MKSLFSTLFLLAAVTFAKTQAPAVTSPTAPQAVSFAAPANALSAQPDSGPQQCERFWNCEADGTFFETRAACRASCSGTCELIDYGC